jgi:hypothetical protein
MARERHPFHTDSSPVFRRFPWEEVRLMTRTALAAVLAFAPALLLAQGAPADTIVPIKPPKVPLPSEAASAAVTKFSFVAYGDTRGRHDGVELQAEHTLVMDEMLRQIRAREKSADPIRFVVQSGDAVMNGSVAKQLAVSYVPIINRLTQDGGIPYYLSVGNHDVGNSTALNDPWRVDGLRNFNAANRLLIPSDGSARRLSGYPTYAFGYGNTFFIAFDSGIPDDEVQFNWVKAQLEGLDRKRYVHVALFFHQPLYTSGLHGGANIENASVVLRTKWAPMFRAHHVRLLLTGHDHLFDHWVERYTDASGLHRIDQIVSGGGGAPLYPYTGEPNLGEYLAANKALNVKVEHLAKPSMDPGANPFHFVIVHVDGERISTEVIGVDWGRGFQPYRSNAAVLTP